MTHWFGLAHRFGSTASPRPLLLWALAGAAACGYFVGAPILGLPAGVAAALIWKRYRFGRRVLVRLPGVLELECYWLVKRRAPGAESS